MRGTLTERCRPTARQSLVVLAALVPGCGGSVEVGGARLEFTTDWVSQNVPSWEQALAPLVGAPDLDYLEVGVFEGRSAVWMFENVLTHPSCTMTAVDPFLVPATEGRFLRNMQAVGRAESVTTLVGFSNEELRRLPLESFELIYVDGSHIAIDVFSDAARCFGLLAEGGILIFDDYLYQGQTSERRLLPVDLRPKGAIDAFLTAHRDFLEVVFAGYQMIVKKVANPCGHLQDCSPIGTARYRWGDRRLEAIATEEPIPLSPVETELLERILESRPFGVVEYDFAPFAADAAFARLSAKLGL